MNLLQSVCFTRLRSSAFLKPIRRNFSYLAQMTSRFKQVDAVQNPQFPNSFKITVPYESQSLECVFSESQTLSDFADSLKQGYKELKDINFYTLDGARIPLCEKLVDRISIPFVMNINNQYSYSINLNPSFSIVHDYEDINKASEEAYLAYCQGIGLPTYTSYLLANFANKFHNALPNKETVDKKALIRSLYETMGYFRSVGHDKSLLKVSELEKMIDERQSELIKLNKVKERLDKKAEFRTNILLLFGSSIMLGQFAFIMSGTFIYFSWDIMEPISYMMLLSNFTFGYFFYNILKRDLDVDTLRDILKVRFAQRLYRKKGLDVERLNQLTSEIIDLRMALNNSFN